MNKAIIYMLLSAFFFAVMGSSVKYLEQIHFIQIVLCRSIVTLVLSYLAIIKNGSRPFGAIKNRKILVLRGITGTIALSLYFYTLQQLDLANAVTTQYLSPFFTMGIAALFLGESINRIQWFLCLCAFLGVFAIYGLDLKNIDSIVIAGVLSAFFSGCSYCCIRSLKDKEEASVVMFYFPLVTIPIVGTFVFQYWTNPSPLQWIILVVIGLSTHFAQYFLTKAYQEEKANTVAIFGYLNVILAFVIGYFLFGESCDGIQLVGLLLVIASLIASTIFSNRQNVKNWFCCS